MSQSERGDEYLWQGCPGIVLRFQEWCAWAERIGRSLLVTSILCVHTGESWGWKNMRNSQPEQIYACTSSKATTPIIRALGQVKPSSQCQNTWDFPSSVIVMLHLQLRWWLHFKINQYNLTKRYSNQHFRWQQAGSKLGILNGWLMLQKLWAQVLLVQTIRSTDFKKHARYGNKHLELMSSPYLLLPFHCVSGETQQSSFTSWFQRFSHQWE